MRTRKVLSRSEIRPRPSDDAMRARASSRAEGSTYSRMRLWFFSQSALSFSTIFLGELRASSPPLLQRHLNLLFGIPVYRLFFAAAAS
jgi:hypothetical protein